MGLSQIEMAQVLLSQSVAELNLLSPLLLDGVQARLRPFGSVQDLCIPIGPQPRPPEIPRSQILLGKELEIEDACILVQGTLSLDDGGFTDVMVRLQHPPPRGTAYRPMLLQEAALLVGLSHDRIVNMVGVVTSTEPIMLALEYCAVGVLAHYILEEDYAFSIKYKLAADIAEGMAYLASQRIVHRNLTSCQVMVGEDLHARVMVSGLSRALGDADTICVRDDNIAIRWMPPEALRERVFSEQSDVWMFGVVMYEIWTGGGIPFEEFFGKELHERLASGQQPDLPEDSTPELERVFDACWGRLGERPRFAELAVLLRQYEEAGDEAASESGSHEHEGEMWGEDA